MQTPVEARAVGFPMELDLQAVAGCPTLVLELNSSPLQELPLSNPRTPLKTQINKTLRDIKSFSTPPPRPCSHIFLLFCPHYSPRCSHSMFPSPFCSIQKGKHSRAAPDWGSLFMRTHEHIALECLTRTPGKSSGLQVEAWLGTQVHFEILRDTLWPAHPSQSSSLSAL